MRFSTSHWKERCLFSSRQPCRLSSFYFLIQSVVAFSLLLAKFTSNFWE